MENLWGFPQMVMHGEFYGDFHKGMIKRLGTCTNKIMHGEFSWEAFIVVGVIKPLDSFASVHEFQLCITSSTRALYT